MKIKNLDELKILLEPIQDMISYLFLGGSESLGIINNTNDIDIIVVIDSLEKRKVCAQWIHDNRATLREKGFDIHSEIQEWQDNLINHKSFPYFALMHECYSNQYESIGEKGITLEEFLNVEPQIIKNFKEDIERKENSPIGDKYISKEWYHKYLTLCIFKNKSLDFTEEQLYNINLLHDRKQEDSEKRTLLIDELIEEIKLWH